KKPRSCFLPGVDSLFRERESLFTKSLLKKYPSTKHGRRCSPERHVVVRRQSEQLFRDVLPVVDVSSEMREHEVKEQREGQGVWLIELSCADHGTLRHRHRFIGFSQVPQCERAVGSASDQGFPVEDAGLAGLRAGKTFTQWDGLLAGGHRVLEPSEIEAGRAACAQCE